MCRLFGFRSAVPSRPHRSLMEAENALVAQSRQHPDGWGIGWFVDDDAYVVKSSTPAHACERFRQVSTRLTSHTFVVHVRRATVGTVDSLNAHPFRHGRWLFAHNGTVFGMDRLRGFLEEHTERSLRGMVLGETDSEALFFYLLSALDRAGVDKTGRAPGTPERIADAVRRALHELDAEAAARGVDRPITNVLLTDGRTFLAHRAGMPLHLSTQKHACADAITCPAVKVCLQPVRPEARVNHLLVASEPLGHENLWEDVPDGATVVLDEDFRLDVVAPPRGWITPPIPERYRTPVAAAAS